MFEQKSQEKGWADATCSATFYFAVEDHILTAMQTAILSKPTSHLSLHFDGVRVDKARVVAEGGGGEHMCQFLEDVIKRETGYSVVLAVKEHLTLLECLNKSVVETVVTIDSPGHLLLKDGNCIPNALTAALGQPLVVEKLIAAGQGDAYQVPGKVRSYREVASLVGCTLSPFVQVGDLVAGEWLLHSDNISEAHCMGLSIDATGIARVHNAGKTYVTTLKELKAMVASSTDKNSMVSSKSARMKARTTAFCRSSTCKQVPQRQCLTATWTS